MQIATVNDVTYAITQDLFSIFEGISGSIESFTIQNSSGTIKTIPAANCVDSVCRYMDEVRPPLVCQTSSGDTSVNVSAANRLGPGPASQPIPVSKCGYLYIHSYVSSCMYKLDVLHVHILCVCTCGIQRMYRGVGSNLEVVRLASKGA